MTIAIAIAIAIVVTPSCTPHDVSDSILMDTCTNTEFASNMGPLKLMRMIGTKSNDVPTKIIIRVYLAMLTKALHYIQASFERAAKLARCTARF